MKFSVTIPAYKKRYLKESIASIICQSFADFELIIVNDASPEDLDSIVNSFDDNRIRYFKNEKNFGAINVVNNWNKCLEYAQGDYIICMGDDDRLTPICLEEYAKLIEKYPGLGVYHAWTEIIDEDGNFYKMQQPRPIIEGVYSFCWNRWHGRNLQFIGDFCFDTKMLREDGGFYNLPMAWASDDITAVRAARYNGIANTQVLCFQYRENRFSISTSGSQAIKMKATVQEKKWYQDFIMQQMPQNETEEKYRDLVKNDFDRYFTFKMKYQMSLDMKKKYWRLFFWICNRKQYDMSLRIVIKAFIKALKSTF